MSTTKLNPEEQTQIETIHQWFRDNCSYIYIDQIDNAYLIKFLNQDWIKDLSWEMKMDLLRDHAMAQQLCDIQE